MTRLRYGIVGAGYMAELHSLALRNVGPLMFPQFPDIQLVRMADNDHDAAIAGRSAGVGLRRPTIPPRSRAGATSTSSS